MSDAISDRDFGDDVVYLVGCMKTCIDSMKHTLAEPARNCDVGTAEEQTARIRKLCTKFKPSCMGCPCYGDIHRVNCWLTWAQMPYEESEAEK